MRDIGVLYVDCIIERTWDASMLQDASIGSFLYLVVKSMTKTIYRSQMSLDGLKGLYKPHLLIVGKGYSEQGCGGNPCQTGYMGVELTQWGKFPTLITLIHVFAPLFQYMYLAKAYWSHNI